MGYIDDSHIESLVDQLAEYGIVKRDVAEKHEIMRLGMWDTMKAFVLRLDEKFNRFKKWMLEVMDDAAYIFAPWVQVVKDLSKLFIKEIVKGMALGALTEGLNALAPYQ